MAEGHVFFVDKNPDEDGVVDSDMVWQDTYTEIVAYEENIEDNSQLNVVYVTEDNISTNEHYVSAVEEDSSQYYSVMETTTDTSVAEQSNETPKVVEETVDSAQLTLDSVEPNISVIEYPSETVVPDDNFKEEHVDKSAKVEDGEVVESAEDDDQVTLYKIEDSNELFAVQIARDADGKIHKYQYKVRQNEDGQLEAVPGTIQIQPEGTDQLICEEQEIKENIVEEQLTEQLPESVEPEPVEQNLELNDTKNDTTQYLKSEITEEIINEEIASSTLYEHEESTNEMEIESHYEEEVIDEGNKEHSNVEYLKEDRQEVPAEQITEETYYDDNEELEEFTNVEYLQEDFEDDDENQQTYENLENTEDKSKENAVIEESIQQPLAQKKYAEGSQIQVLSDVVLNENRDNNNANVAKPKPYVINNNSQKHLLNKISDLSFLNENIELKQISNPTANRSNKLTFLIVTQPVAPQHQQQKPTLVRTAPIQPSKKFRSILRPSISTITKPINQPSKNTIKTVKPEHPTNPTPHTTKMLLLNNVMTGKTSLQTPLINKGVRQPRKQVITPVDRVGSEIIIQAPEEKAVPVETLDLDDLSDNEYSPKSKTKVKKVLPKKRGRKPAWAKPAETASTQDQTTPDQATEPATESNEKSIKTETQDQTQSVVKTEVPDKSQPPPKYTLPPKKRGPGRPKLSERKTNFIEKEIIEHAKTENGTPNSLRKRGRPKLIRTQRKYTNVKLTSKVSESKENKETPKTSNEENVTPRRRGRPPKKPPLIPPNSPKLKEEQPSSPQINEDIKLENEPANSSADSETEDKQPAPKKSKTDIKIDKQMDSIMNEMDGIHGGSNDDDDIPMIEEHLESDADDENAKKETLLSILETPNEKSTAPDKEDVLTRALKDANILNQSDGEEGETNLTNQTTSQVPFLDSAESKTSEPPPPLPPPAPTAEKKDAIDSKNNTIKKNTDSKNNLEIYKCVKCAKTFSNYLDLKTHMQEHNSLIKGKFKCNKCPRIFTLESALKIHEKIHGDDTKSTTRSGTFKCVQCSRSFTALSQLRAHQQTHKNFKCDKCPERFSTRSQLLIHIRGHIKDNLIKTTLTANNISRKLRKSTQDKTEFSEIIRSVEKNKPRKTLTPSTNKRINSDLSLQNIHRCNVCAKTFRQLAHLVMHREVHNKPTCVNCGKVFAFKHSLNEHMRRYCLKSSSPKNRKSLNNSTLKRKSLNQKETTLVLKRQTIHSVPTRDANTNAIANASTANYKCKYCDKKFRSEIFCNKHMKTHNTDEKSINNNHGTTAQTVIKKCYVPLVDATRTSHEQPNSAIQTNREPSAKRATIGTLAPIVERRQSDRKQVPSKKVMAIRCDMCNLSFTTYTGLFRHTRTHPDITEKCDFCNAGFETKELLKKHMVDEHLKGDVNECGQCQQSFDTEEELNNHKIKSGHDIRSPKIEANLLSSIRKMNMARKAMHSGIQFHFKTKNNKLKRKL